MLCTSKWLDSFFFKFQICIHKMAKPKKQSREKRLKKSLAEKKRYECIKSNDDYGKKNKKRIEKT